MNYKMTDYDIKRCFQESCKHIIPVIFIDDYWDYYMKLFNLESKYELFKEQYKSAGFQNYQDFYNKLILTTKQCADIMFNTSNENVLKKLADVQDDIQDWTELEEVSKLNASNTTKYTMKVDLISGADSALKYLNLFNTDYSSTQEIINDLSSYDIFKNNKTIRILVYRSAGIDFHPVLQKIESYCLIKKLYETDSLVKKLTEDIGIPYYKLLGDSLIYNIDSPDKYKDLCKPYQDNEIPYHIDLFKVNYISIFGNCYDIHENLNTSEMAFPISLNGLEPLTYKLCKGEQPNEMDLAVGLEDKIFLHLNENDYETIQI